MPPVMPLARLIKVLPFGLSMKGLLPLHDITGAGSTILADRVPFGIGSQPIARFTCHEPDKKIGQIFRRVPMDLQGTPGLGTCESLPWGRYWRPSLPPSNSRLRQQRTSRPILANGRFGVAAIQPGRTAAFPDTERSDNL